MVSDQHELAGEVFPHPDDISTARRILIYEMDEGGIGVLNRVPEGVAWSEVCRRALEIIHTDEHGADSDRACLDSCYECLRTFYNQWHHDRLDRTVVIPFLVASAQEVELVGTAMGHSWPDVVSYYDSETEQSRIEAIRAAGIPAPSQAHVLLPTKDGSGVEADLFWSAAGLKLAVLVDGGIHDDPTQSRIDPLKRAKLKSAGYSVVVIRYDDLVDGIDKLRTKLAL